MPVPAAYGTATDHVSLFRALFGDVVAAINGQPADDPLFATFADGVRLRDIASAILA